METIKMAIINSYNFDIYGDSGGEYIEFLFGFQDFLKKYIPTHEMGCQMDSPAKYIGGGYYYWEGILQANH